MDIFSMKTAARLLVTAGVGKVIDDIIDSTAPEDVKLPAKVLRKVGSWSLGWFIGDWVSEKAEETYATIETSVKELSSKVKEVSKTIEAETANEEVEEAEEVLETES